ncbi:MAG: hypothetical protein ABR591_00055 [Candidatus Velthaea sp.]
MMHEPTMKDVFDALLELKAATEGDSVRHDGRIAGFDTLRSDMNRRFDRYDERFDRMDERFDRMDKSCEDLRREVRGQRRRCD